ncbi:MAG TPA: hypothetical protein PJ984_04490, partial [Candidatus Saccharibacteria bacterium]|nr:hypothetical protein [Candidatus Saccharibacteria bacterium]
MSKNNWKSTLPSGARLVNAAGNETDVSLSEEVSDMPAERIRAFQAGLDELFQREVDLAAEDVEVRIF